MLRPRCRPCLRLWPHQCRTQRRSKAPRNERTVMASQRRRLLLVLRGKLLSFLLLNLMSRVPNLLHFLLFLLPLPKPFLATNNSLLLFLSRPFLANQSLLFLSPLPRPFLANQSLLSLPRPFLANHSLLLLFLLPLPSLVAKILLEVRFETFDSTLLASSRNWMASLLPHISPFPFSLVLLPF